MRCIAAFVFVLSIAAPALAEEGTCYGFPLYGDESALRLMRVESTAPRVHFIENRAKDKPACPNEAAACQRKGFVVPGDVVIADAKPAAKPATLTCVSYIAPGARRTKGVFAQTHGFVPAASLGQVPDAAPKPADWVGKWSRNAEAEIEISTTSGGKLKVFGEASYGALDPGRVARGAINIGELSGEAAPGGNRIALGEGYDGTKPMGDDRTECRALLRLYGRYLVVVDSGGCGGNNVSFTGLYVQLKK